MRTETSSSTFVAFEELSDEQKEKAIENNRHQNVCEGDSFWSEYVIDDAKEIAAMMGIDIDDIFWSGFWSQGDGACFVGSFRFKKGSFKTVKSLAPEDEELHRIAKGIADLQKKARYGASGSIRHIGHYYHEHSMSVSVESEFGSVDGDEWDEVFADFALWIYRRLEKEYEYQTSDDAVAESLVANETEFEIDEDGELV